MENYEINNETMALIPLSKGKVKVLEYDEEFILDTNATQIMEDSCQYFGSSLEGRRKGTEVMIGVSYKAPIIVEETFELIFFPLSSSRYHDTPWISLKYVDKYYKEGKNVVLEFLNGRKILLDVTFGIFDNQLLRATRLKSALRGRKVQKKHFNRH